MDSGTTSEIASMPDAGKPESPAVQDEAKIWYGIQAFE